ncbi:hypothetical protein H5410_050556 [Solanum commersonii]|uniref:Uncharacterized protein n=1 Tax=Solanum commersonii TaxID=4109 RepID=A0A9J5WVS7_SOLCO|nr:hypothetical protein H5410_050556 [Solanum commersonii]
MNVHLASKGWHVKRIMMKMVFIRSILKRMSLNVIDNDKVLELLHNIKDPDIRAQIIDKISNTSTSKDKDHIPEQIPTKEGSYTMAEIKNLFLKRRKLIISPTTISVPFINDIFLLTHWDNNKVIGTWNNKLFILEFVTKPFTRMINDLTSKLISKNNQVNFIKQEINKYNDLRWKHDPWQLMTRYLDSVCYTTTAYIYRMHYEIILSLTGSAEFQHFYPTTTRKVYNFSKIIIKKIITPEEWGMSPSKERDDIHPKQKVAVKYNYWDYVDSFNKVLLYENANKKHSWFIKICSNVFTQPIPNWFCKWWTLYDPSIKILPDQYKSLYAEWVDISPKLMSMAQDNIFFKGMAVMYFFIDFSVPWIMK